MATPRPDTWIMLEAGTVLVERASGSAGDFDVLGGVFAAINSVASAIDGIGLKVITAGRKKLVMYKRDGVMFVVLTSAGAKEKAVDAYLARVADAFFRKFPPGSIDAWNGDCTAYEAFASEIDAIPAGRW